MFNILKLLFRKKFYKGIIFFLLFFSITYNGYCQLSKGVSFAFGLNTITILGNNPGNKPLVEPNTAKPALFGGGFKGVQPGIEFMIYFPIQDSERVVLPIGVAYNYFDEKEKRPLTPYLLEEVEHSIDVFTFIFGLDYTLKKYQIANAKIYLGLECRSTMIENDHFYVSDFYKISGTTQTINTSFKPTAIRFGTTLKAGLSGQIAPHTFVNFSLGLGILNLIGKDDKRGELFTVRSDTPAYLETKESTVYTYHLAFLIQYKL